MSEQAAQGFDPSEHSPWAIRLAMAARGWISSTHLERRTVSRGDDDIYFFIRFSRWDWHGRSTDRIQMSSSARIQEDAITEGVASMAAAVRRATARALEAWDKFPHAVPRQAEAGMLEVEPIATKYAFGGDGLGPAKIYPFSEAISPDLIPARPSRASEGEDPILSQAVSLLLDGSTFQDELTYMRFSLPGTVSDRTWGYNYEVRPKIWHGVRVMPHWMRFSAQELGETSASLLLAAVPNYLANLRDVYFPGSPNGSLPPGMEYAGDYLNRQTVQEESRQRAREVAIIADADGDAEAKFDVLASWQDRWRKDSRLRALFPEPSMSSLDEVAAAAVSSGPKPR